jgi:hypothetical protein
MPDVQIGQLPGGGAPWGGIVKAETPFTDKVTAALLQQQNDRRQYQQKVTASTDEMMNRELANVRSTDMGGVIDNYGKWKDVSMQMLSPKVMSDPKLYNQLQIQKNAALGATMAAINDSAQRNAQMKEMVAERKIKPNLYADNFGDLVALYNNTPASQLHNVQYQGKTLDLTNPDTYRRTSGRTNFQDLIAKASGQYKPIEGAEKREKISDLQTRITPTEFGNTPAQFQEALRAQLAQAIPGQDAAAAWEAIPEQQKAAVDQQIAAMSPERWQAITGQPKPQVLAPIDPNNGAENWAAYQAKIYALNAAPRAGTPQVVTNEQAKIGLQEAERLRTVDAQHANRMLEIAARYTNQKDLAAQKARQNDPEATTPTVETIQSMLEHPGQVYNGKTAAQISQDVLSNWNSQGNTKNVQSKLTVVPSFNTSQTNQVKGFRDLQESGVAAVGQAYNALPKEARSQTWGQLVQKWNDPNTSVEQKKQLLANAYNEINQANGSPVRFTPDDLDKSVPVLHSRREVDDKFDNTKYQVVKTGTSEFENVINEKRNAVLSSKKPVIAGSPGASAAPALKPGAFDNIGQP